MELEDSLPCSQEHATVHILSQIDPVHVIPFCPFKIYFNIISHLRPGIPCGFLPSGIPTKALYEFPLSSVCVTCPASLM
jgi:hypothetical protein